MVKRQKTLFKKYLRISLIIMCISIVILSSLFFFFMSQYWKNDKYNMLDNTAVAVSNLISQNSQKIDDTLYINSNNLIGQMLEIFARNINADIMITDNNGKIIICTSSISDYTNTYVSQNILSEAIKGNYFATNTFNNMYSSPHYVSGIPIILEIDGEVMRAGIVFVTLDASSFYTFSSDMLKIAFFAAIAALIICFCITGLFTYNMVRPLRQMSIAAKCFGEGDFSKRVHVTSNDEIGELATAFNNMAESLSSSESIRRSFIANVSHELKTPMTTIAGFIDGILDGTIPPDKEKYYLHIVSDEVKRLSRLVKSMLDLSRIDSGSLKLNFKRFDMTETVLTTLLTFEQQIDKKNIEILGLENNESVFIDGDPDMLHQVVYNLVENAVKFVNKDGYIEVLIKEEAKRLVISIKNSGEGISSEEIKRVFERFYKTDKSRSQDKNGMGLGLYIVKTIIRLHGGEINVESKLDEYCKFEFWIPKKEIK